jgi:hypothetical protein
VVENGGALLPRIRRGVIEKWLFLIGSILFVVANIISMCRR